MQKLKDALPLLVGMLIAAACIAVCYQHKAARQQPTIYDRADTVTIIVHDTVTVIKPQPVEITQLPSVIVRLPLWCSQNADLRTATDSLCSKIADCDHVADVSNMVDHFPDSAKMVDVVLPIERKVYEDSTYRAVVSGAFVSLDSLTLYPTRITERITIRTQPRRWSLGLTLGYGLTPHGLKPFVGVGVCYRLW